MMHHDNTCRELVQGRFVKQHLSCVKEARKHAANHFACDVTHNNHHSRVHSSLTPPLCSTETCPTPSSRCVHAGVCVCVWVGLSGYMHADDGVKCIQHTAHDRAHCRRMCGVVCVYVCVNVQCMYRAFTELNVWRSFVFKLHESM